MRSVFLLGVPLVAAELKCGKDEKYKERAWRENFCDGSIEKGLKERCLCKGKRTRTEPGGECVKDCADFLTSTCKGGQVWKECSVCFKQCNKGEFCAGVAGPDGKCPGGCNCPDGTQWLEEKKMCVPDSECTGVPNICPPNSTWNTCASPCEPTCKNPDAGNDPCIEMCEERCDCDTGFLKDENGQCVPEKTCLKPPPKCESNQIWTDCKDCWSNCEGTICADFFGECPGGCTCPEGMVWNDEKGLCTTEAECHNCPANSKWNLCGSACDDTCQNPLKEDTMCTMQCVEKCDCQKGFKYDEDAEECVPEKQCPTVNCGENQRWEKCPLCIKECGAPDACIMFDMCMGPHCGPFVCPTESKCVCEDGFREDPDDPKSCIPESVCKECGVNEKWNSCSTSCESTCQNPDQGACTMECVPQCECIKGTMRDELTGLCVPVKKCPPPIEPCPPNEHWDKCSFECGAQCQFPKPLCNMQQPDWPCNPGCTCDKGFLRDEKNICRPEKECPNEVCSPGSLWKRCASKCEPSCNDPEPSCDKKCDDAACQCEQGLLRNEDGICVKPDACPPKTTDINCGARLRFDGFVGTDADLNGLWTFAMNDDGTVKTNHGYAYYKQQGSNNFMWWMWHGDEGHWVVNDKEGVHGGDRIKSTFGLFSCPQDKESWEGPASVQKFSLTEDACCDEIKWFGKAAGNFVFKKSGDMNEKYPVYKGKDGVTMWWMWHNEVGHWVINKTPGRHGGDLLKSEFGDVMCPDEIPRWNEPDHHFSCVEKPTIECDKARSTLNSETGECDCNPGFQKHTDGACYAFLSEGKVCDTTALPFWSHYLAKKCADGINVNRKCKIQCKFDKKTRSKDLPKAQWIHCVPAKNSDGKVIGSEFKYAAKGGYEIYDASCGKGCSLMPLMDYMGPSVESTNCNSVFGFIEFGGPKTCKMRCRKSSDTTKFSVPKKAFSCLCKDNDDSTGRVCNWRWLDSKTPAKAFDKKFWLAQEKGTDGQCMQPIV